MARITVEDCLGQIGNENRFILIHLAVARIKQHRKGQEYLVKGKNKEIVMTLREIAAGEVSFENIKELKRQYKEKLAAEREEQLLLENEAAAIAAGAPA
jgi:DNA-directed RNA polymerase subunit omega